MKSYLFRVVIEQDEDVYHAYCPALKGCHTWGKTVAEAYANIQEAIQAYVESLLKSGESVPVGKDVGIEEFPEPIVAIAIGQ